MTSHIKAHRRFFLFLLGYRSFAFGNSSVLCLGFTIGLGFGNLAGDGPRATPAHTPARFPISPVLFFLISRLGNFDDNQAFIELLLVEDLDGLLGGLGCGERNEPVACRLVSAHYYLSRDAVAMRWYTL
jgi:hypothetical protein